MTANISTRSYIYFLPHPLPEGTPIPYSTGLPHRNPLGLPSDTSEPSSVLVLTTASNTFVDIRILKPIAPGQSDLLKDGGGGGSMGRLDWAFSGKSSSKVIGIDENGKNIRHSRWEHLIDSRHNDAPTDEGDMYEINSTQFLEFGSMFNESLNSMQSYEEMWVDIDILSTLPNNQTTKHSVILTCDDVARGAQGTIVRVGQYCQGLLKVGGNVTVERWEFVGKKVEDDHDKGSKEVVGGEWVRTVRLGNAMLPCNLTLKPESVDEGLKITYGENEWLVEEVREWNDEERMDK